MSSYINIVRADAEMPRVKCEVATTLSDPDAWTEHPSLFPNSLVRRVNAYDQADFTFNFGAEMARPEDDAGYIVVAPLELLGKFVKLTVHPPEDPFTIIFEWVGIFVTESSDRNGVKEYEGTKRFVAGDQTFIAVGLEYFLDRRQITSAIVDGERIERPMVFNGGFAERDTKVADRKNRHTAVGGEGVYEFAHSPTNVALWTAKQIIEHLLKFQTPGFPCPIALDEDAGDFLDGYTPTVPTEKLTTNALLSAICSPSRGLCWWLEYNIDANEAKIRVQSNAVDDITLPGGGTLGANSEQVNFDFDAQSDIEGPKISRNRSNRYDQVIARGARMTSTFTLGYGDSTLVKDWTDDAETLYKYGAKFETGYSALSDDLKARSNDAFRRKEEFARVFQAHRIPSDWDGKTADGGGTLTKHFAIPILSDTGSVLGGTKMGVAGLRLLNHTTLKRGFNYTSVSDITGSIPAGTQPELMPPFAIVKVGITDDDSPRFQFCHAMSQRQTTDMTKVSGKKTSYHLHLQSWNPGFILPAANKVNHCTADGHFTDAEPTTKVPELDYTDIRGTFTGEADKFCEGRYPSTDPAEPSEVLIIQLSDEYRLDYIAQDTIYDLKNGVPQKSGGGVLRDDRKDVADVARFAWQWYETERRTCQFAVKQIANWTHPVSTNPVGIGSLLTSLGDGVTQTDINTLIAEVSYSFTLGATSFTTAGDQLDPRAFTLGTPPRRR